MKFYSDFTGDNHSDISLNFISGDLEQQFIENALTQPPDWYYRDIEITYSYNNYGHRCKNFKDIDQDNYILFIGCSHTMGVGLELDKTYPHLLSKKLQMDYYNLAIPATGIDIVEYNLLTWFFKQQKKPKLVVIQWPDHSRFVEYDAERHNVIEHGTWDNEPDYVSFIVNAEDTGMYYARKAMTTKLLKNIIDVPMVLFNFGGQQGYWVYDLSMPRLDRARDLSHSGNKSHAEFTKTLLKHIEVEGLLK
jgi:hypothetical protein